MLIGLRVLGSRIWNVIRERDVDDYLDRELESHLEMLAEENFPIARELSSEPCSPKIGQSAKKDAFRHDGIIGRM